MASSVWERTGSNEMNKNAYAFMLCFWTALGIASSAAAASVSYSWKLEGWNGIGFALGVLVVAIAGVFITLASENPAVSLFGYGLVTVPFGLLTGPLVAQYTPASVVTILSATTGMVVALGILGAIIPESLESWGAWLFGGLLILLGGLILLPILGAFGVPVAVAMTVWDWVGVLLFSAYVIFDLNRAMRVPYTMDNSIDCALAVYLDFANIFIRLLSLFGNSSSSK